MNGIAKGAHMTTVGTLVILTQVKRAHRLPNQSTPNRQLWL